MLPWQDQPSIELIKLFLKVKLITLFLVLSLLGNDIFCSVELFRKIILKGFRLTTMPATHSRLIYRGFLPIIYILGYPIKN